MKKGTGIDAAKIGKAQLKVLLILLYYVTAGIVGLIGVTYATNNRTAISQDSANFLKCQIEGTGLTNCFEFISGRISSLRILNSTALVMFTYLPVVHLFFGMDFQMCRKKITFKNKATQLSSLNSKCNIPK